MPMALCRVEVKGVMELAQMVVQVVQLKLWEVLETLAQIPVVQVQGVRAGREAVGGRRKDAGNDDEDRDDAEAVEEVAVKGGAGGGGHWGMA